MLGLILLALFVRHALRRKAAALIDLRLFTNRIFSGGVQTQFLSNGLMYAGQFLIPLYLITGCRLSPTEAGWILAPMGIGMMCSYPLIGMLTERFGYRAVSLGGVLVALLGTLPFLWMVHAGYSSALVAVSMVIRGAGQGGIGIPSISAAYTSVPREVLPIATTAMNIVQRLGGPTATTILAILMSVSVERLPAAEPHSYMIPFVACVVLHLLTFASATRLPARVEVKAAS